MLSTMLQEKGGTHEIDTREVELEIPEGFSDMNETPADLPAARTVVIPNSFSFLVEDMQSFSRANKSNNWQSIHMGEEENCSENKESKDFMPGWVRKLEGAGRRALSYSSAASAEPSPGIHKKETRCRKPLEATAPCFFLEESEELEGATTSHMHSRNSIPECLCTPPGCSRSSVTPRLLKPSVRGTWLSSMMRGMHQYSSQSPEENEDVLSKSAELFHKMEGEPLPMGNLASRKSEAAEREEWVGEDYYSPFVDVLKSSSPSLERRGTDALCSSYSTTRGPVTEEGKTMNDDASLICEPEEVFSATQEAEALEAADGSSGFLTLSKRKTDFPQCVQMTTTREATDGRHRKHPRADSSVGTLNDCTPLSISEDPETATEKYIKETREFFAQLDRRSLIVVKPRNTGGYDRVPSSALYVLDSLSAASASVMPNVSRSLPHFRSTTFFDKVMKRIKKKRGKSAH